MENAYQVVCLILEAPFVDILLIFSSFPPVTADFKSYTKEIENIEKTLI